MSIIKEDMQQLEVSQVQLATYLAGWRGLIMMQLDASYDCLSGCNKIVSDHNPSYCSRTLLVTTT